MLKKFAFEFDAYNMCFTRKHRRDGQLHYILLQNYSYIDIIKYYQNIARLVENERMLTFLPHRVANNTQIIHGESSVSSRHCVGLLLLSVTARRTAYNNSKCYCNSTV